MSSYRGARALFRARPLAGLLAASGCDDPTARKPGVVTIGRYVLGGYRDATLRIVERPGS